ncbi:hypothetical protein [Nostocoides vanveenii]|uniref:CopG family transcriptional regulator n=1 Tax=Nostocoides vanveenii TaxID=330835 RepID=A0ABN2KXW7_9MICO
MELSRKQYVPLSAEEQEVLHGEAQRAGMSHGLLARVLLLHGLDHVDDPEVTDRIRDEKRAGRKRIRAGARAAARVRWDSSEKKERG